MSLLKRTYQILAYSDWKNRAQGLLYLSIEQTAYTSQSDNTFLDEMMINTVLGAAEYGCPIGLGSKIDLVSAVSGIPSDMILSRSYPLVKTTFPNPALSFSTNKTIGYLNVQLQSLFFNLTCIDSGNINNDFRDAAGGYSIYSPNPKHEMSAAMIFMFSVVSLGVMLAAYACFSASIKKCISKTSSFVFCADQNLPAADTATNVYSALPESP